MARAIVQESTTAASCTLMTGINASDCDEAASEVLSIGLKPNPVSQTVTLTLAVTLILALNLNQWAFFSSD